LEAGRKKARLALAGILLLVAAGTAGIASVATLGHYCHPHHGANHGVHHATHSPKGGRRRSEPDGPNRGTDNVDDDAKPEAAGAAAGGGGGATTGDLADCVHVQRVDWCEFRVDDCFCRVRQRRCLWWEGGGQLGLEQKIDGLTSAVSSGFREVQSQVLALRKETCHPRRENGDGSETAPMSDNEALRLFALLKALESETNCRKAPVTRVFRLYCLEGMTRNAIARQCRCAPSLVSLRFKAIRKKLGRKLSELRQVSMLSSHFEQMEASLRDDRARRIHRTSAMDDGEYAEDG
jgi:hypothetical protein